MIQVGIIGATGYAGGGAGPSFYTGIKRQKSNGTDPEAMWIRNMRLFIRICFRL